MGEVYRARDSRLGRDVAIEVLPASSSTDADRLQRFEQEARAAAALNHPNILALYVVPFQGPGGKWQVSSARGAFPKWRGEAPRALFRAPVASFVGYQYAVTRDGQRFLVNTAVPAPVPVTVVSDWTLTLKK
jgi:serine/threonine protein kinase